MKRILILAASVLLGGFAAQAELDPVATKQLDNIRNGRDNVDQIRVLRVSESAILPEGVIGAAEIAAGAVGSSELASGAVSAVDVGVIAQVYTGATAIVETMFTPAFVGQALIGAVSGTVHIAGTLTTNGWLQVK